MVAIELHPGMLQVELHYFFDFGFLMVDKNFNVVVAELVKIDFVFVIPDGNNKGSARE